MLVQDLSSELPLVMLSLIYASTGVLKSFKDTLSTWISSSEFECVCYDVKTNGLWCDTWSWIYSVDYCPLRWLLYCNPYVCFLNESWAGVIRWRQFLAFYGPTVRWVMTVITPLLGSLVSWSRLSTLAKVLVLNFWVKVLLCYSDCWSDDISIYSSI